MLGSTDPPALRPLASFALSTIDIDFRERPFRGLLSVSSVIQLMGNGLVILAGGFQRWLVGFKQIRNKLSAEEFAWEGKFQRGSRGATVA